MMKMMKRDRKKKKKKSRMHSRVETKLRGREQDIQRVSLKAHRSEERTLRRLHEEDSMKASWKWS